LTNKKYNKITISTNKKNFNNEETILIDEGRKQTQMDQTD